MPGGASKCEFSKLCQLINTPEGYSPNMEGVCFLHDVKPNMREKILSGFVLMGNILYNAAAVKNLSAAEELDMRSQEYTTYPYQPISKASLNYSSDFSILHPSICSSIQLKW